MASRSAVIARHRVTLNKRDLQALCNRIEHMAALPAVQTQTTSDMKLLARVAMEMWERNMHGSDTVIVEI